MNIPNVILWLNYETSTIKAKKRTNKWKYLSLKMRTKNIEIESATKMCATPDNLSLIEIQFNWKKYMWSKYENVQWF